MTIEEYIKIFSRLRTDKVSSRWPIETNYQSPHKPLLLLAVIDLFSQGYIDQNIIELDMELGELFSFYWINVLPNRDSNMAMPFYHLINDGFWHLLPKPGYENAINMPTRSVARLKEAFFGAKLDDSLYELLQIRENRNILRKVLIRTYFSSELETSLHKQSEINVAAFKYSQQLLDHARTIQISEKFSIPLLELNKEIEEPTRNQGFRRAVVWAYQHRCAFCGIRILTPENHTVVEAAHIVPWSESHNDDPRNGIALCKLCHWIFDKGLGTVSDRYLILISPKINSDDNISGHVFALNLRDLIKPTEKAFFPDLDYLKWHRERIFHRS